MKTKTRSTLATGDVQAAKRADSALQEIERLTHELSEGQSHDLPFDLPAGFLLSVLVPVYNERFTIARVISRIYQLPLPIEVIVVDDGSEDGTVAELTRLNRAIPELQVCLHAENQGKGAALRHGLELANGSHVVVQDADLEYDPVDIVGLVEAAIHEQSDAVYGSRFLLPQHSGSSWVHRWGNRMLTVLSNQMTGLSLTDMETCYKLIRRDVLSGINLEQDRFGFEVELTAKLAKRTTKIAERPVGYAARTWQQGKKIGIRDAFQAIFCILKYR